MENRKFSISERLKSFKYAFNGLRVLFNEEHNARIHLIVALIAIALGFVLHIRYFEWISIIMVIGIVFITEILNTSIENMADFVSPEKHPKIKIIKDLSAAAVLISAIVSVIIGFIVFLPKLLLLIE